MGEVVTRNWERTTEKKLGFADEFSVFRAWKNGREQDFYVGF